LKKNGDKKKKALKRSERHTDPHWKKSEKGGKKNKYWGGKRKGDLPNRERKKDESGCQMRKKRTKRNDKKGVAGKREKKNEWGRGEGGMVKKCHKQVKKNHEKNQINKISKGGNKGVKEKRDCEMKPEGGGNITIKQFLLRWRFREGKWIPQLERERNKARAPDNGAQTIGRKGSGDRLQCNTSAKFNRQNKKKSAKRKRGNQGIEEEDMEGKKGRKSTKDTSAYQRTKNSNRPGQGVDQRQYSSNEKKSQPKWDAEKLLGKKKGKGALTTTLHEKVGGRQKILILYGIRWGGDFDQLGFGFGGTKGGQPQKRWSKVLNRRSVAANCE